MRKKEGATWGNYLWGIGVFPLFPATIMLAAMLPAYFNWGWISTSFTPFWLMVAGTYIMAQLAFWPLNLMLALIDLGILPSPLRPFKLQPSQKPTREQVWEAFRVSGMNLGLLSLPSLALICYVSERVGFMPLPSSLQELPPLWLALLQIAGCSILEEFGFYWSHRLLHHPRLYKHLHKEHHTYKAPFGAVGVYAGLGEFAVSNLLPLVGTVVIVRAHILVTWAWTFLALSMVSLHHSGYELPWIPFALTTLHDRHHQYFNCNYGVLGVLDWLHGTSFVPKMEEKQTQKTKQKPKPS